MKVGKNTVVEVAFELFDSDKNLIDSATKSEPMPYIHGIGQLLPSVEEALDGKDVNYCTTLKLRSDQAYGPYHEELVVELPKAHFPEDITLQEGMCFNTEGPDGQPLVVEITKLEDDKVTVDGNHPLAGVDLEYFLEIVNVREATQEELDHGHVHSPGGCGGGGDHGGESVH